MRNLSSARARTPLGRSPGSFPLRASLLCFTLCMGLVIDPAGGTSLLGRAMAQHAADTLPTGASDGSNSWPMRAHDAGASSFNADERLIGPATVSHLHPTWSFHHVLQAVATQARVYAITDDGRGRKVVVLDAKTGGVLRAYSATALRLSPPAGGSCCRNQPEVLADGQGRLIVGTLQEVLALDPTTGRRLWRVQGGATSLTISGGRLYTAKLACQNPCGPTAPAAIELASGRARLKPVMGDAPPVLAAGRLYRQSYTMACCQPAPTQVYDPGSGRLLATFMLGYSPSWMGDASNAYVSFVTGRRVSNGGAQPARCRQYVARVGASGKLLWRDPAGGSCQPAEMALAYHTNYVGLDGPHSIDLLAIDGRRGRLRWRTPVWHCSTSLTYGCQQPSLAVANRLIFAFNVVTGEITVVEARTGRVIRRIVLPASYRAAGGFPHPMMVAEGTVYALGGQGHFLAVRP